MTLYIPPANKVNRSGDVMTGQFSAFKFGLASGVLIPEAYLDINGLLDVGGVSLVKLRIVANAELRGITAGYPGQIIKILTDDSFALLIRDRAVGGIDPASQQIFTMTLKDRLLTTFGSGLEFIHGQCFDGVFRWMMMADNAYIPIEHCVFAVGLGAVAWPAPVAAVTQQLFQESNNHWYWESALLSEFRFIINVIVPSNAGARLILQVRDSVSAFTNTGIGVLIDTAGLKIHSPWASFTAIFPGTGETDLRYRIAHTGGNGTAIPSFRNIIVQAR